MPLYKAAGTARAHSSLTAPPPFLRLPTPPPWSHQLLLYCCQTMCTPRWLQGRHPHSRCTMKKLVASLPRHSLTLWPFLQTRCPSRLRPPFAFRTTSTPRTSSLPKQDTRPHQSTSPRHRKPQRRLRRSRLAPLRRSLEDLEARRHRLCSSLAAAPR